MKDDTRQFMVKVRRDCYAETVIGVAAADEQCAATEAIRRAEGECAIVQWRDGWRAYEKPGLVLCAVFENVEVNNHRHHKPDLREVAEAFRQAVADVAIEKAAALGADMEKWQRVSATGDALATALKEEVLSE